MTERVGPLAWLKAHPTVVRTAAVVVFFAFWEWAARDMSPLFMATPSAIGRAAWLITLNAWMGATHFLTRTLYKVRTEMSLHVLAYNLKRMISIFGAGPLMAAIRT